MEDKLRNYSTQHQQYHHQDNHRLIIDDDDYNSDQQQQQDNNDDTSYHNFVQQHRAQSMNNNNKAITNNSYKYYKQTINNSSSFDDDDDDDEQQQARPVSETNKRPPPPPRPSSICHSEDGRAPSTISFNSGCYSLLASWKQKRMRQQAHHHPTTSKAHSTLTTTSRASSTHRPESTLSSYISSKLRITKPKRAPLGLSQHYVTDSRRRRRANELILRTIEARRRLMAESPTFSTMTDNTAITGGRHSYSTPIQPLATSPTLRTTTTTAAINSSNTPSRYGISNRTSSNNNNNNNHHHHQNGSEASADDYTANYMTSSIRAKSPSPKPMASSSNHRFRANSSSLSESYITTSAIQKQPPSSLRQNQQQHHHQLYLNELPPPLAKLDDTTSESDEVSNNASKSPQSKLLKRHLNTSNISVSSSSNSSDSTSASLSHLVTDEQKEDLPDCIMRSASSLLELQREAERNSVSNLRARRIKQQSQVYDSENLPQEPTSKASSNNNSINRQHKRQNRPALRRDSMRRMRLLTTTSPTRPLNSLPLRTINQRVDTTTTYGQNMLPRGPLAELNNRQQSSARSPTPSRSTACSETSKPYEARKDSSIKNSRLNDDNRHSDGSHSSRSTSSVLKPRVEESRSKRKTHHEREMSQQQTNATYNSNNARVSDHDSNKATTGDRRSNPDLINIETKQCSSPKSSSAINYYNKSSRLRNQFSSSQPYNLTAVPNNMVSYDNTKKTSTIANNYRQYIDDEHRENVITNMAKTTSKALDNNDEKNESTYQKSSFIEEIMKNKGFKIDRQHPTDYVNVSFTNDRGSSTDDIKTRPSSTKQQQQQETSIKKGDTKYTMQSDTSISSGQSKSELATHSDGSNKSRTQRQFRPDYKSYNYTDTSTTSSRAQSPPPTDSQKSQYSRSIDQSETSMSKSHFEEKRSGRFIRDPQDIIDIMSSKSTNIVDDARITPTQMSKNKSEVTKTKVVKASSSIFNDGQEMSLNSVEDVKELLKKMTPNSVLNVKTTTTVRSESEGSSGYPTYRQSPLSPLNIRDFTSSPNSVHQRERIERNQQPDNHNIREKHIWSESYDNSSKQGATKSRKVPPLQAASQDQPTKVFTVTSDRHYNDLMGNTERLLSYAKTTDNGSTVVLRDDPGQRSTVERKEKSFESYILNQTYSDGGATRRDSSPGRSPTIRLPTATTNAAKESESQSAEQPKERDCHESRNRIQKNFTEESTKLGTYHDFRKGQTIHRDVDTTTSSVDEQLKKLQIIKEEIMGVGDSRNSYRRIEDSKKKRSDFFSSSFSSFPNVQLDRINSKRVESNISPSQTTSSYANYDRELPSGARYAQQRTSPNTHRNEEQSLPKTAEDRYTDGQAASLKKQTVSSSFPATATKSMRCPEVDKYQSSDAKKLTPTPLQQQSRLTYYESSLDNHDQSLSSFAHDSSKLSDTSIEQNKPKTSDYRYQQTASATTTNPERIDYSIKSMTSGQPFARAYTTTKSESGNSRRYSGFENDRGFTSYPSKFEERLTSSQTSNNNKNSGGLNSERDTIQSHNNYITTNYDCDDYFQTKSSGRIEKNVDCQAPTNASSRQREQQESIRETPVSAQNTAGTYQIKVATKHQSANDEQWSSPSDRTPRHYEQQNKNSVYHSGQDYPKESSSADKKSQRTMISTSTPSLVSVISSSSSSSTPMSASSRLSESRSSSNFRKYGQQPLSTSAIVKLVVREKITPHVDCVQQPEIKLSTSVAKPMSGSQEVDDKNFNPASIVAKRAVYATNSSSQKREQQHSPSSASESSGPQSPVYTPTSGFSNDSALASSVSSHSPSSQATTASNTSSSEDNCSVTSNEIGQEALEQSQHHMSRSKSLGQTSIHAIQSDMHSKEARTLQGILRYRRSSLEEDKKHAMGNVPMIDSESDINDESDSTKKDYSRRKDNDSNTHGEKCNYDNQKLGAIQLLTQQQRPAEKMNIQQKQSTQFYQQQQPFQRYQEDLDDLDRLGSTFPTRKVESKHGLVLDQAKQSQEDISQPGRGPQLVRVSQQQLQQPKRVHFNDRASIRSFESLTSASVISNEDGQSMATGKGEELMKDQYENNDDEDDDHEDYGFLSKQNASTQPYNRSDEVDNSKYHQAVYTHESTGYSGIEREKMYLRSPSYATTTMAAVSNYEDEGDDDYVMRLRNATKAFIAPTVSKQNLIISPQYQYQQHQRLTHPSSIDDADQHLPANVQHVAVVEPLNVLSQHVDDQRNFRTGSSQSGFGLGVPNEVESRQSQDSEEKSKRRPIRLYTAV